MEDKLVSEIYKLLRRPEVLEVELALQTKELYIVGGCIRDLILGKKPKDIDFAVDLKPDQVLHKLYKANIKAIETGLRRGTVTALVKNPEGQPVHVEITTFRNPKNEKEFAETIDDDLPARDFTLNAVAICVATGDMIDPFNGREDIQKGIIRAVGYPDRRFKEDPHRILRMIRFGFAQKGWAIDVETLICAQQLAPLLQNVSVERIREEFVKILTSEMPSWALRAMVNFGIMKFVVPEILPCVGFEQNHYHTLDVFEHILKVVDGSAKAPINRLVAFFHDIAKPDTMTVGEDGVRHFINHEDVGAEKTEVIMRRLKFSTDEINAVKKLISLHMRPVNMGSKGIRRLMIEIGDLMPQWLDLKEADFFGGHTQETDKFEASLKNLIETIEFEKNRVDVPRFQHLAINGHDIMSLGIKSGPKVGEILKQLQNVVIDNPEMNYKDNLIEIVKTFV